MLTVPLVTLTTDFGEGSPYVAAIKARLLHGCPGTRLVDVSHSVPAFDVAGGGFVLWAGTRDFDPGAVHLAVVDPGVGSGRRAVALRAAGSLYVGPDNGLFEFVLRAAGGDWAAVELDRPGKASATFEGRDVFAPAAARLACGEPLRALGSRLPAAGLVRAAPAPAVLWVDRFGNLVTALAGPARPLRIGGREVRQLARTYAEATPGTAFVYLGSMDLLEVGVPSGRADVLLAAAAGTPVEALEAPPAS